MTPTTLPMSDPNWAVTMFSLTTDLVIGDRSPLQLMEDVLDAGLTDQIEIDAPQHFASYPRIDAREIELLREVVERRGVRLSMLGIYNDAGVRRESMFTLDESEAFVADQIRAASELGFWATRIMFGTDPALLERLAVHAEEYGVPVLQEVQGGARPESEEFDRQRHAIERIGSDKLGFVFDLSACMAALPVTYLETLRREGVPDDVVSYLEEAWLAEPLDAVKARIGEMTSGLPLEPATRVRLAMPFGRFGNSRVEDWRDSLGEFSAIHLKYWDLDDESGRVSGPIADVRREFGAIGYTGVVTSEWGGHEWFTLDDPDGIEMTRGHRAMYDAAS